LLHKPLTIAWMLVKRIGRVTVLWTAGNEESGRRLKAANGGKAATVGSLGIVSQVLRR